MRAGAIDGLSIGFRTVRATAAKERRLRATILEADLWEISVVTFPMQPGARVDAVKSAANAETGCRPTREFERWLTQDAGLTRSEARTVIAKGFANLPGMQDAAGAIADGPAGSFLHAARRFRSTLQTRNGR